MEKKSDTQELNLQNIQTAHATQQQQKTSQLKNRQKTIIDILQRRHADSQ